MIEHSRVYSRKIIQCVTPTDVCIKMTRKFISLRALIKPTKKVLTKKLKKCRDDSCKSRNKMVMTLAKVKEQDGMTLAKVRHGVAK